jgi:hypothetical protein
MPDLNDAPLCQVFADRQIDARLYDFVEGERQKHGSGTKYSTQSDGAPIGYPNLPNLRFADGERSKPPESRLANLGLPNRSPLTEREVLNRDVANAKDRFDRLLDLAGVPKGKDMGLSQKQLDKLAAAPIAGADRDAVNFLRKNFDELCTEMRDKWLLGEWWCPEEQPIITMKSLMAYKDSATSTGRRLADGPPPPPVVKLNYAEKVISKLNDVPAFSPVLKVSLRVIDELI